MDNKDLVDYSVQTTELLSVTQQIKGTLNMLKFQINHSENQHRDICYGRRLRVMLNCVQCI